MPFATKAWSHPCYLAMPTTTFLPSTQMCSPDKKMFLQERLIRLGVPQDRVTSSAIRTLVEGTQGLPRRLLHVCDLVHAVCERNTVEQIQAADANAVMSTGLNRAA